MGQTGLAAQKSDLKCSKSCTSCGEWGEKDASTVKINLEHLPALLGKQILLDDFQTSSNVVSQSQMENIGSNIGTCNSCCQCESGKIGKENVMPRSEEITTAKEVNYDEAISRARQKLLQQQEQASTTRQAEAQLIDVQQNEMMQRVREELQRIKEEQDRQDESMLRTSQLELDRQVVAEEIQQEKEALRLQEQNHLHQESDSQKCVVEEGCHKQEEDNEKTEKAQAWLRKNGFKDANELKRKKLHKVRPLHVAIQKNDAELVKLLLSSGADINMPDGKNETPVQLAERLFRKENCFKSAAVLHVISESVS